MPNAFEGLELPQFDEGDSPREQPRPRGRPPNPKPLENQIANAKSTVGKQMPASRAPSTDELDILVEIMGILNPLPLARRARIVQALVKAYHE